MLLVQLVFNIEVFNTCQLLFWLSKIYLSFLFGALHQNVLCKVSTSHSEGLLKTQLDFRSWHSIRHFQVPLTPATSTQHQLQLRLASMDIYCECGFPKHNWVKSDHKSQLKLETSDALMWVSLCGLPMDCACIFDTWKSTKKTKGFAFGVGG